MSDNRSEELMTPDQIKHMVDRFLGWRLPENFAPDGGVGFERFGNKGTPHEYRHEPSGTNLLDAVQAEMMVRYMAEGMPAPPFQVASDNAELIVRLRSPSGIGEPLDHAAMCEAADALERAERERNDQEAMSAAANVVMDHMEKVIAFQQSRAESAERDLRVAAANEAAMREALVALVHEIDDEGIFDDASDWPANARAALSTPASALAQRYEAVVTAARKTVNDKINGVVIVCEACAAELYDALAALDHPMPAKDDAK